MNYTKIDKLWIGISIGLIVPLLTLILFFPNFYKTATLIEYLGNDSASKIISKIITTCVIPNAGLFFLFDWKRLQNAQKGVLLSTFIYAIFIFIYYFTF